MNKNSEQPEDKWVYGAEARAAALAAGRSDWMEVTGWPLHLEQAWNAATKAVQDAGDVLRDAQKAELAALNALMAKDAVQKRPLEPQPTDNRSALDILKAHAEAHPKAERNYLRDIDPTQPHAYKGNRSMDTCWVGAGAPGDMCRKPLEDPIHTVTYTEPVPNPKQEAMRVRRPNHQHEAGQVREAPDGSHYCAACGDTVQGFADGVWRTVRPATEEESQAVDEAMQRHHGTVGMAAALPDGDLSRELSQIELDRRNALDLTDPEADPTATPMSAEANVKYRPRKDPDQ